MEYLLYGAEYRILLGVSRCSLMFKRAHTVRVGAGVRGNCRDSGPTLNSQGFFSLIQIIYIMEAALEQTRLPDNVVPVTFVLCLLTHHPVTIVTTTTST